MKRFFFLAGISYFLGLFFSSFLKFEFLSYILILFFVVLIFLCLFKKLRHEKTIIFSLFIFTLVVFVSFINYNFNIKPLQNLNDKDAVISGKIIDIPYKKNEKYYYTLQIDTLNNEKIKPFKTKISSGETLEAEACDRFTGKVHFYCPENSFDFFDSKKYYSSKGIHILAYCYTYLPFKIDECNDNFDILKKVLDLRKILLSNTRQVLPQKIANVINGFLLGEKNYFPSDVKNSFDEIGISHLIATSAIHISVINFFVLWILKKLKLGRKSSHIIICFVILFFMSITSFTPSITKAGIIALISNIGIAFLKSADPLNSIGIAIIIICVFNVNSGTDISLWLSILSSLGIILLENKIKIFILKKLKIKSKILKYFVSIISVSMAATLFTFPICAWVFKKCSILFIISNILVIPLSNVLLILSFIFQFFYIIRFKYVYTFVAYFCNIFTKLIINISFGLSKIPFSSISLNYGFVKLCISFSLILISVSILFKNSKTLIKISLVLSFVMQVFGIASYIIFTSGLTTFATINCGDSLALVISKNFRKTLILFSKEKINISKIEEYLFRTYNYTFDYLILIANDSFKNKSLLQNLREKYPPQKYIIPKKIESLEESPKNIIYDKNFSLNLCKDIKLEVDKINNANFAIIKAENIKIILYSGMSDMNNIPTKYKNADFFIATDLPNNYNQIKVDNFIISSNKRNSEILINKLISLKSKIYSTFQNGNIYIDIKNNKYLLRRVK